MFRRQGIDKQLNDDDVCFAYDDVNDDASRDCDVRVDNVDDVSTYFGFDVNETNEVRDEAIDLNGTWRPVLPLTRNPHFLQYKSSNCLPNQEQELIIDHTVTERLERVHNHNLSKVTNVTEPPERDLTTNVIDDETDAEMSRNLVQTTLNDYFIDRLRCRTNVNDEREGEDMRTIDRRRGNLSLFDIDSLSPLKDVTDRGDALDSVNNVTRRNVFGKANVLTENRQFNVVHSTPMIENTRIMSDVVTMTTKNVYCPLTTITKEISPIATNDKGPTAREHERSPTNETNTSRRSSTETSVKEEKKKKKTTSFSPSTRTPLTEAKRSSTMVLRLKSRRPIHDDLRGGNLEVEEEESLADVEDARVNAAVPSPSIENRSLINVADVSIANVAVDGSLRDVTDLGNVEERRSIDNVSTSTFFCEDKENCPHRRRPIKRNEISPHRRLNIDRSPREDEVEEDSRSRPHRIELKVYVRNTRRKTDDRKSVNAIGDGNVTEPSPLTDEELRELIGDDRNTDDDDEQYDLRHYGFFEDLPAQKKRGGVTSNRNKRKIDASLSSYDDDSVTSSSSGYSVKDAFIEHRDVLKTTKTRHKTKKRRKVKENPEFARWAKEINAKFAEIDNHELEFA